MFTGDIECCVLPTRQGSVVVDFVLLVNARTGREKIHSTLVDAAQARDLALTLSPDDVTLSGMFTKITV